jgi:hypothetical protein
MFVGKKGRLKYIQNHGLKHKVCKTDTWPSKINTVLLVL